MRTSERGNVYKRCACVRQNTCKHPWWIDVKLPGRKRDRRNLDLLIGNHPTDLTAARAEAARAIDALRDNRSPSVIMPSDDPTVADLLGRYLAKFPRKDRWQQGAIARTPLPSPSGRLVFGEWKHGELTAGAIEDFRDLRPLVAGNRDIGLLRAAFNWAVREDMVRSTPFLKAGVPTIAKDHEDARTRRLRQGEEVALRRGADPHLGDCITGILELATRITELLSIQWSAVFFAPKAEVLLLSTTTKSRKPRRVPMSLELQAVLERRRLDPAGEPHVPAAYVFGDEAGRRVASVDRAWNTAVLRAYGHRPSYIKERGASGRIETTGNLTRECRDLLQAIDLHVHDLRREAASRWHESGVVDLLDISHWLGHANISQTSTYLAASEGNAERAMARYVEYRNRVTQCAIRTETGAPQRLSTDTVAV
jgi:integrase